MQGSLKNAALVLYINT